MCAAGRAGGAVRARCTTRASRCPIYADRYLEENVWRSIRWGLDWELIDFARPPLRARARSRARPLVELCGPEIDALGLAPYLPPLERILDEGDNASRRIRRVEAGETHREIFAEQVALMRSSVEQDPVPR